MPFPDIPKGPVSPDMSNGGIWLVQHGLNEAIETVEDLRRCMFRGRGLDDAIVEHFFTPNYDRDIHDPLLFPAMGEALDRIFSALKKGERILVHGDYDTDGITGAALLTTVLQQLGGSVIPFIPHRFEEGYGLNQEVITALSSEFDLLITVDCGISNAAEIASLKKNKKDTIIVDHHELADGLELPKAQAILHPRYPTTIYPFSWLSGAGVAWKLCQALLRDKRANNKDEDAEKWLLDFAMLGTVADMVPMIGENRLITRFGLEVIRRTKRPGLLALIKAARLQTHEITAESLSWRVIPLLNAAGKMEHAQPALDLLLTKSEAHAQQYIAQLMQLNTQRRSVTEKIMTEAEALVLDTEAPVIFAANTKWPAGVVGLVAGKLANKYNRPAVVVGGNGRHGVGSARAPQGVNILNILKAGRESVLKMGGHARAAGFSVEDENIVAFREAVLAASADSAQTSGVPQHAEALINSHLIHWDTLQLQDSFAPFGEGNKKPSFVARSLQLASWKPVGKQQTHAKCTFLAGDRVLQGIGFSLALKMPAADSTVDVLFDLSINEYRGNRSLQLEVRDIAKPDSITIQEYDKSNAA